MSRLPVEKLRERGVMQARWDKGQRRWYFRNKFYEHELANEDEEEMRNKSVMHEDLETTADWKTDST